jgi:transketolase
VGGSKTLRDGDDVAIVAAGITLHEALRAADALAEEGVSARVIDCYSVKPIDGDTLAGLGMPIVTVEDHRAEGGLGEAVLSALAERGSSLPVTLLAVRALPQSGPPAALLAEAGIDADHIAEAARAAARAAVAG